MTVALWPWAGIASVADTLRDIIATSPDHWLIFVPAGDGSAPVDGELAEHERRRVSRLSSASPSFAAFVNAAATADPRADVIVIADAVRRPVAWAEGLWSAAHVDDTVAAATPLAQGGSSPHPQLPLTGMAEAQPAPASPSRPRTVAPGPHCAWLRRSTLDLVALDESLQPSHPTLVLADFAARALDRGLSCTIADDLSLDVSPGGLDPCPPAAWETLWRSHPWLQGTFADEQALQTGPLRRSLVAARAVTRGLSVTVDARGLAGVGGTQTYTGALVLALARSPRLSVRAVVAPDAPSEAMDAFSAAGVQLVSYEQAAAGVVRTDVIHRPQQVFTPDDLGLLRMVGERIVISHMDLIAFRVPTYHPSLDAWRSYRRTTRVALAAADHVLFFSDAARRDAISEGLVTPGRTGLAGIGVDRSEPDGSAGTRPQALAADSEFLLALGTDYAHKNRPFALALMRELRRRHSWPGLLVLAGPHVVHGSSAETERDILTADPDLAGAVVHLGPVSGAEKRWLLEHATAHVTASTYEGFGLAPLEAAAAGRPCVYAPCTSLAEIIDPAAATIVAWDPIASADAAIGLLVPGEARTRHLELLDGALSRFAWPTVVADVIAGYEGALAAPYGAAAPRAWDDLTREELIVELAAARDDLQTRVAHGQSLIDRRDPLLTEAQQRGLMRVASRPWLRGPLLAPFGLLGADDHDGG